MLASRHDEAWHGTVYSPPLSAPTVRTLLARSCCLSKGVPSRIGAAGGDHATPESHPPEGGGEEHQQQASWCQGAMQEADVSGFVHFAQSVEGLIFGFDGDVRHPPRERPYLLLEYGDWAALLLLLLKERKKSTLL